MARSRAKVKGRKESGPFLALPRHIIDSSRYIGLSHHARSLLIDLFAQYRGNNNGDYAAAWKLMNPRGWRSRDTLDRALTELLASGFIVKTRQGGRNMCSLYGVTWLAVDECDGKLDIPPSRVPLNTWKQNSLTRPPCQLNTPAVSMRVVSNVN